MITQEYLRSILHYSPETGDFTWIKTSQTSNKKPGDSAGHVHGKTGYESITINGKFNASHRLAWLYMTGSYPADSIDHINQVRSDNRWCNLRDVDTSENLKNRALRIDNKSSISGVRLDKQSGKWEVRIGCNNKRHYFGRYGTKEKAIEIRNDAMKKLGFSDIHGLP